MYTNLSMGLSLIIFTSQQTDIIHVNETRSFQKGQSNLYLSNLREASMQLNSKMETSHYSKKCTAIIGCKLKGKQTLAITSYTSNGNNSTLDGISGSGA